MSYYDATFPSRPGKDGTSDTDALFLKLFSGEIITTFETNNVMMPLHRVRTISSGKEAQFPVTGTANALYHTPGESILSAASGTNLFAASASAGSPTTSFNSSNGISSKYVQQFAHREKTIKIDDVLTSSVFVADIDQMKNHYDVRSIYSTEIGRALSYVADRNLIRVVIAGSRRTTDRFGGSSSLYLGGRVGSAGTLNAANLTSALFSAAQSMDEKNVPSNDRYAVLLPKAYHALVSAGSAIIDRDYNPEGNGSMASGSIYSVAGIRLMKSNNIPTTDESSAANVHNSSGVKNDVFGTGGTGYGGISFATNGGTLGVIFQKEAIGTVKLMDLSLETEYFMDRLGHLILAKYAMGHDVLREECCFELTLNS